MSKLSLAFLPLFVLTACAGTTPQAQPAAGSSASISASVKPASGASSVALGTLANVETAAMSVAGSHWPEYVAQSKGFYQKEGLDVKTTVMNADATVSGLVGGSIDISFTSAAGFAFAVDKAANLLDIGAGIDRAPYKLMSPPQIKSVGDLKGKIVGAATAVEPYTQVIRDILKKGGLDPEKDVQWTFGSSSNTRMQALLGGAVQATLVLPPEDGELRAKGYNTLASTLDYYPNLQLSLTAVRKDWAQQHQDTVRRYMKVQAEASQWLNDPANKQEAVDILAKVTKSQPSSAAEAYDAFVTQANAFPNDACVQETGLQKLIDVLKAQGQIQNIQSMPTSQYIDRQWCLH